MAIWTEGDRPMWFHVILLAQLVLAANVVTDQSGQDSVRWQVSEFRKCSTDCGGGIQVRSVQCVRSETWDEDTKDIEVPDNLCPLPSPSETRPCNTHKCAGHWRTGEWSECSETCGAGTYTREVTCESSLWHQKRVQIAETQCPGHKPTASRQCHMAVCPDEESSEPLSIISENYTLIQLHRDTKIQVNIGGQINLFPGQTVIVKCPIKNYNKEAAVYWSTGYRLVKLVGRVRGSEKGLEIDDAVPSEDAGVYTCILGELTATVTIGFIDEDDPVTKQYKKWIRKSKQQYKKYNRKHKNNGKYHGHVLTPPTSLGVEEPTHQRDQSRNSSSVLMYVIHDWSSCNDTCQSEGYQKRNLTCSHVTSTFVKIVPDAECQTAGVKRYATVKQCNSTKTSCAVWRMEPWSECHPSCGQAGNQSRILTCVWESTGEPAGRLCGDLTEKPEAKRPCKPKPCSVGCIDSSQYCSLTKMLKLCRYHYFKKQCCRTCDVRPELLSIPTTV